MVTRIRVAAIASMAVAASGVFGIIALGQPSPDLTNPEIQQQWIDECIAFLVDEAGVPVSVAEDEVAEVRCGNAFYAELNQPDVCLVSDSGYRFDCLDGP